MPARRLSSAYRRTASRHARCRLLIDLRARFSGPGRVLPLHLCVDRAALDVRAGQVAAGHQELVDDLSAGEDESLLEELRPFVPAARVVGIQPAVERAELGRKRADAPGVLDGRVDFQTVA